jgi:hypothetical protein
MNEAAIKLEMRFSAIEFLLCKFMATFLVASGKTEKELEVWRNGMRETLRKMTFGGLDPSTSDVAAAELEETVDDLLALLKAHMVSVKAASQQRGS